MKEIESKIIEILKRYTFNETVWETYNVDSKIIQDLKINSARIIDLTLDIEEEYNIEVDDEKIDSIITVRDLINVVKKYKKK